MSPTSTSGMTKQTKLEIKKLLQNPDQSIIHKHPGSLCLSEVTYKGGYLSIEELDIVLKKLMI